MDDQDYTPDVNYKSEIDQDDKKSRRGRPVLVKLNFFDA